MEFTRRWSLHILPKGYTKTRRYGGYSNHHRKRYIAQCLRALLDSTSVLVEESEVASVLDSELPPEDIGLVACSGCGEALRVLIDDPKPSWRDIMNSRRCPRWYEHD